MDDMMNRAAEALAKRRGVRIVDEVDYAQFAADARAVIEALREPTKAMLAAVALRDWTSEKDMDWSDGWRVMIDAVLAPLP